MSSRKAGLRIDMKIRTDMVVTFLIGFLIGSVLAVATGG
jgi:hypothetical protein